MPVQRLVLGYDPNAANLSLSDRTGILPTVRDNLVANKADPRHILPDWWLPLGKYRFSQRATLKRPPVKA